MTDLQTDRPQGEPLSQLSPDDRSNVASVGFFTPDVCSFNVRGLSLLPVFPVPCPGAQSSPRRNLPEQEAREVSARHSSSSSRAFSQQTLRSRRRLHELVPCRCRWRRRRRRQHGAGGCSVPASVGVQGQADATSLLVKHRVSQARESSRAHVW